MKKRIQLGSAVLIMAVFAVMFTSCLEEQPATYDVWTEVISYYSFQDKYYGVLATGYPTLSTGYYNTWTINNWSTWVYNLPNSGKKTWTEDDIRNYLLQRNFSYTKASEETAWLITVNHGLIATRTGDYVYLLHK